MKDEREVYYEADQKVAITFVDVTSAAETLVKNHLCGPTAAYFLSRSLAAAALLGSEMSEKDEVLSIQMKCEGPLGGLNVECSAANTLRGYTEQKLLEGLDDVCSTNEKAALGTHQKWCVTRSVPGRIISQGLATSLNEYIADSLQRKARLFLSARVTEALEVCSARGMLIEYLPDAVDQNPDWSGAAKINLENSPRTILKQLGLGAAELKGTTPLAFGCHCSKERAAATLVTLTKEDGEALPPTIDIICHMCGKMYTLVNPYKRG